MRRKIKVPTGKTIVELRGTPVQSDLKKGDHAYIDGYIRGGEGRPYAVVVRLRDGLIDLTTPMNLKALGMGSEE